MNTLDGLLKIKEQKKKKKRNANETFSKVKLYVPYVFLQNIVQKNIKSRRVSL